MLEKIGHPVIRLIRVSINGVKLGELKPGHYRPLTKEEIEILKKESKLDKKEGDYHERII